MLYQPSTTKSQTDVSFLWPNCSLLPVSVQCCFTSCLESRDQEEGPSLYGPRILTNYNSAYNLHLQCISIIPFFPATKIVWNTLFQITYFFLCFPIPSNLSSLTWKWNMFESRVQIFTGVLNHLSNLVFDFTWNQWNIARKGTLDLLKYLLRIGSNI